MGVPRNSPCPCGSGKKYKNCCFQKNYIEVTATKKDVVLSTSDDVSVKKKITDINSIPFHNKNGLRPNISKDQMIDLCLDEIFNILKKQKVGMLADLVNDVIKTMDIVPIFTYHELAIHMEDDGRFSVYKRQICSLKGTDPLELIVNNIS